MPGVPYVVAAIVFLGMLVGAHEVGYHRASKVGKAELAQIKSELEAKVAQAEAKAATVSAREVIKYRDRVVRIRETAPEVAHEIQVIRNSPCVLPPEWVRLHDFSVNDSRASGGTDETASCADALEVVRENYLRSRENAAQLEALQAWAAGVSAP
jgi:hypothetical protein